MYKKLLIYILFTCFSTISVLSQSSLMGTVKDDTNEPVPFANVSIWQNGSLVTGAVTDFDGNYIVKPIEPGKYTIKATFIGFQDQHLEGVIIAANKIKILNFTLKTGVELEEVEIVKYKNPLIEADNTVSGQTVTKEEIEKSPIRNASGIAANTGGVFQKDDGADINVRGARGSATDFYIDGVKVRGSVKIPRSAIEQISTYTGGVPAQFGDATGGIVQITTSGPANKFSGGGEITSSQFLDKYGYNIASLNFSGPLIKSKDTNKFAKPIAGYFLSAEFEYQKDPYPSSSGSYKLKDDVLSNLQENPLSASPNSSGVVSNSQYITTDDIEKIGCNENINEFNTVINTKLDFNLSEKSVLTIGGSASFIDYAMYKDQDIDRFNIMNTLFNQDNNSRNQQNSYRGFMKFTYKFDDYEEDEEAKKKKLFKNSILSGQVSFNKYTRTTQHNTHEDNFFNYGYVGKFENSVTPNYIWDTRTINGKEYTAYFLNGYEYRLNSFERSELNPILANYTTQYMNIIGLDETSTMSSVVNNGGLINGGSPAFVYSMWNDVGTIYNSYNKVDNNQYRAKLDFSSDIKNHEIRIGFEFEQKQDRSYSLMPVNLWTQMRLLANKHIVQLSDEAVIIKDEFGVFQDTISFNRLYDSESQSYFDEKLREKLGLSKDDLTWIDIDAYDPDFYSLDMFSADELYNDGGGSMLVQYNGYNHLGEKTKGGSFKDFLTETDENGNYTRKVSPFEPISMAGYISDKFMINNIIFNIGFRIERYDANQMVLKDKYVLAETYKASDVTSLNNQKINHPDGVDDDFVVYVNQAKNPTNITGYRDGDQWYDKNGEQISDPSIISDASESSVIMPYLKDLDNKELSINAFENYKPQYVFLPRVSFSFPISESSLFFAHYDILSSQPNEHVSKLNPTDYLFFDNLIGSVINNPNLKPEKTTDYEIGFQQKVSKSSALKLSVFYRELRDMIRITNITGAYPKSYLTFDNIDFGTVKGTTIAYDLRRTNNLKLNANYTLQYAKGTGSDALSGLNLAQSGQPSLRYIFPFDYDQRHSVTVIIDYRYGEKTEYKGPIVKDKQFLRNTGCNFIFNAGSGLPYSAQSNLTNEAAEGIKQTSQLSGAINGSRMPWIYRVDMKIDRDVNIVSKKKIQAGKKEKYLNVYLEILNLLNTQNITDVFRYTGNPDDDGYISASENEIENQLSPKAYKDLYRIKLASAYHYAMARRFRIGAVINF